MTTVYFKIETLPMQNGVAEYRKKLLLLKHIPKVGNATKEDTIKRKKIESYQGYKEELDNSMQLSPLLSRVAVITLLVDENGGNSENKKELKEIVIAKSKEVEILYEFLDFVLDNQKATFVSFNGRHFDVPFILARLVLIGVDPFLIKTLDRILQWHLDISSMMGYLKFMNTSFETLFMLKFGEKIAFEYKTMDEFQDSKEYRTYLINRSRWMLRALNAFIVNDEIKQFKDPYLPENIPEELTLALNPVEVQETPEAKLPKDTDEKKPIKKKKANKSREIYYPECN